MKQIFNASLFSTGRAYADTLIAGGNVNKTAAWAFTAEDGNSLLGDKGDDWANYGKNHLGVDTGEANNTKAHWKYPFAKGGTLYRSALTAIRQRASQQNDTAVFDAAGALLEKIDGADAKETQDKAAARILHPREKGRPVNYKMTAKGGVGEVYLYDTIGGGFMGGISAKQFGSDLKALGAVKTINLRVNSDGGDVFEGRTIYTQLAQHPARVVAYVDGVAASIASLIIMAANEIRLADGAFVMIHNAWGFAMGDAREMRRMGDLLDSVTSTIVDTYAARTRQPSDQIKAWMNDETWMTGQEAVDRGFADVLDEPVKVAASINNPLAFKKLPAALKPNAARATAALDRIAALKA